MSLTQEILYAVSNYPGGYRIIYDLIYGSKPASRMSDKEKREQVVRSTLTRLRKLGYISNKDQEWRITPEGMEFLKAKQARLPQFFPTLKHMMKEEKKLIVSFDIPEKRRKYRDWLRAELIGLGFEQMHESVWFGPSLPKEFVDYLAEAKLLQYMKFFKASPNELV